MSTKRKGQRPAWATWGLLLAAAVIVPSCGSDNNNNNGGGSAASTGSSNTSMSADGNLVAFDSTSSNLVAGSSSGSGSSNGSRQVFLFNRTSRTSRQISTGSGGSGNGESTNPMVSANGQWVVYESTSTNLTPTGTTAGTTAGSTAGTTAGSTAGTTASSTAGTTSGTTSGNNSGNTTPGDRQIFVTNVASGQTRLVSMSSGSTGVGANGNSTNPSISADGQRIAFESDADNLVSSSSGSNGGNGRHNVYVVNMSGGAAQMVSAGAAGSASDGDSMNPMISANGQWVVFESMAGNLVTAGNAGASNQSRIFIRDLVGSTTRAVTPELGASASNGDSTHPTISSDGRFVAFESAASNLVTPGSGTTASASGRTNVFVWDRASGQAKLVTAPSATVTGTTGGSPSTEANGDSHNPWISGDGRFVAFDSQATDLTTDTSGSSSSSNVYVRDVTANTTTLISKARPGTTTSGTTASTTAGTTSSTTAGTTSSTTTAGTTTAGTTTAGTSTAGTTSSSTGGTTSSTGSTKAEATSGNGGSHNPSISLNGTWVAFSSDATDLTSDSASGMSGGSNVYLANRTTGVVTLVSREVAGTTTSGTTAGTTSGTTSGTSSGTSSGTTSGTTSSTTSGTTSSTTRGTTSSSTAGTTIGTSTAGTTGGTTIGTTSGATTR